MSPLQDKIDRENLKELERQLERLGFFSQNNLIALTNRLNEVEGALYGLINTLLMGNSISSDKLKEITALVGRNMREKGEQHKLEIFMNTAQQGDASKEDVPMVNCNERLHICKAVCCKLRFALEPEEIEAGIVKWDLGIPYHIRQGKDGYCTHINDDKCGCTVYDDRPKVCRNYNCTNDKRIWTDFKAMKLNTEWIAENIKEKEISISRS